MKTAKKWISTNWLLVCAYGLGLTAVLTILWARLGSLVPGLSPTEVSQYGSTAMTKTVLENPLYLPQKILQLTGYVFGLDPVIALRGASTVLGILVLVALYYVLKAWYSQRIALLGSILLLTSGWFLHVARHGSTAASYMCLFLAFACIVWVQKSRASALSVLASATVLLALLYTPGMIWFVVPLVAWRAKWILQRLGMQKPLVIAFCVLGGVLAITPLILALTAQPGLVRTYLGLPESWPSIVTVLGQIVAVPFHIFARNTLGYELQLSSLPLVSWFTGAMFAIGTYAYFFKRRLDRTWTLVYIFAAGTILIGLGGNVQVSLLLPFVILVATGGIALMLQQWFTVFPRNPFARTMGLALILIAIGTTAYYGTSKYFVAWSNAPETKRVFQHKL